MPEPPIPERPRPTPRPGPAPRPRPPDSGPPVGEAAASHAPGTARPDTEHRESIGGGAPSVAGPLGRAVECHGKTLKGRAGYQLGPGANALIVLRRVGIHTGGQLSRDGELAVLRWAGEHAVGQDAELTRAAAARRDRAVAARLASGRRRGQDVVHRRLLVQPLWRMVTGLGERANAHEIGIALHGTYGWPVIPGSTLKGATRAWAGQFLDEQTPWTGPDLRPTAVVINRMFGPAPPGTAPAARAELHAGSLDVLDALPAGEPMRVTVDGLTPHVQPYYAEDTGPDGRPTTAPGEWHNPVPNSFLTVSGGRFAVDVIGPQADCERFAAWCQAACDDLGVGAKTGAGYGYLLSDDDHGGHDADGGRP
jgi:CRISPR type III-B/RAMP module RAMP protein Cmr6